MWKWGLDLFAQHAHKRRVAFPIFLAAALVLSGYLLTTPSGGNLYLVLGLPLGGLVGATVLHWAFTRMPRIRSGAIGVAFAISCEDQVQRRLLRSDFIGQIKRELLRSNPGHFQIVELPDSVADELLDLESVLRCMNQTRCHFIVYGHLRRGRERGKEWHALRLNCTVRHTEVEVARSKQLSIEMAHVLPPKMLIDCENDLSGFELTSSQYANGARLIIATAALLSGDIRLATSILESLATETGELRAGGAAGPGERLQQLLRKRLWNCHIVTSKMLHANWRASRSLDTMREIERHLERANEMLKDTPDYLIEKAICHFVLRRDVAAAERALLAMQKKVPADATWRYGVAFLRAYRGDLQGAWRLYREAFDGTQELATPVEIEEFMTWVLSEEPDKYQLHYCLGVINMHVKGDYVQAAEDFNNFLSACPDEAYKENRDAAQRYLRKMEQAASPKVG